MITCLNKHAYTSRIPYELIHLKLNFLMRIGDAFSVLEDKLNSLHRLNMKWQKLSTS
jgi:hypothetical protein